LIRSHNVGLVMIYRGWFGADIPASWQRIATLYSAHSYLSNGGGNVEFYATSLSAVPDAISALLEFRENLRAAQNIPAKIVMRVATPDGRTGDLDEGTRERPRHEPDIPAHRRTADTLGAILPHTHERLPDTQRGRGADEVGARLSCLEARVARCPEESCAR
jgi:hypothetical protein